MVKRGYVPDRGDIVWVTLNPQKGREQKGRRPALIISPKIYNEKAQLALMCPITSKSKNYPFEVINISKKINGVVLADQIRSLDWIGRQTAFIEKASSLTLKEVQEKLLLIITAK